MDPSYSRKSWISPREWTTAKAVMAAVKLAVFALIEAVGYAHAAEVAGVRIDANARVGGIELELNGAGLRQRFATKVYVIGLYLREPNTTAGAAIHAAGPKRISLTLMRDVPAQALVDALYEGVRDNTTDAEFARVETSANALASVMLPLQTAKKGDVVALDYLPDSGAQVVVNGRPIGQPITNEELYRALLKIWIGDPPVDADLKRALLRGQAPRKLLATERNK
jgi:hypothetical protein